MGCVSSSAKNAAEPKTGAGSGNNAKTLLGKEVKDGGLAKSQFIRDNTGKKISEFYQIEKKKLGEGSFGSVNRAKNLSTGAVRACKTISKAHMTNAERFEAEIALMKIMDHPNIIKLHETFEDHRNIYLIMELCSGGELFDRIIEAKHFTEVQAAILMQQIIQAIYYMHQKKVCHRDLKPENFLFATKGPIDKSLLKIIDFGMSRKFEPGQVLKTKVGTPYYVAPEVCAGKYDHMSDLWSCGVLMYVLLCGYPPFSGDTDAEVLGKVRLGNFTFPSADWNNISQDAKDLISQLLKMNTRDRVNAEQALSCDWIKNKAPKAKNISLQSGFVDNLRGFRSQNKLKKAALQIIAGQLNESQIKRLRETFQALDDNGDGFLTAAEMKEGMTKSGLNEVPPDLQAILEGVDADGSGKIDYTEFLAATLDKKLYLQEQQCWSAFRVFDKNGDGTISLDELKHVLDNGEVADALAGQDLEALLREVDTSGDGEIDFDEFMAMMRKGTGAAH
jgi:calcium-dependent protein kinase